jgi:hypothetical protein
MSDTSWDSYSADESAPVVPEAGTEVLDVDALQADLTPVIDAADLDGWQGDTATSWADWNQDTANQATVDAAGELDYAADLYAGGYDEAGDLAVARAEHYADSADSYGETASDYSATAASEYQSAADGYGAAADVLADPSDYTTTSYDTTSYDTGAADTTSYDTTSYDTGAADTAVADTSYDTSTE